LLLHSSYLPLGVPNGLVIHHAQGSTVAIFIIGIKLLTGLTFPHLQVTCIAHVIGRSYEIHWIRRCIVKDRAKQSVSSWYQSKKKVVRIRPDRGGNSNSKIYQKWRPLAHSFGKQIDTSKRKMFALAISARKTKKRILDWWTSLQAIRALFPFK
jgi:hypothetical protein